MKKLEYLLNLKIDDIKEKFDIYSNFDENRVNEINKKISEMKDINIDGLDKINKFVLLHTLKNSLTNEKTFLDNLRHEMYNDLVFMSSNHKYKKSLEKLYNESKFYSNQDAVDFYKKALDLYDKTFA